MKRHNISAKIILLLAVLIFSFSSCSNLSESAQTSSVPENSSSKNLCNVRGRISKKIQGAVPEEIAGPLPGNENPSGAKTAFPSISLESYFYEVKAYKAGTETLAAKGTVDTDAMTYSLNLPSGEFDIKLSVYKTKTGEVLSDKILSGSTTVEVQSAELSSGTTAISLLPNNDPGQTGTVALNVKVDSATGIDQAVVSWTDPVDDTNKNQTLTLTSAGGYKNVFTMTPDGESGPAEVNCGSYPVVFKFYSSGSFIYSFVELVNVYENLQTTSWINSTSSAYLSGSGSTSTISIEPTLVEHQGQTSFVVNPTSGNDSNGGGYFDPLKTLQQAVNIVTAVNDGTSEYTIHLDGTIYVRTGDSFYNDGTTDNLAGIITVSPLKLCIEGGTIDSHSLCRGFYVGENVTLTLKDTTIYSGLAEAGGAVYLASNSTLNVKNTVIENNKATYTGGAICAEPDSVINLESDAGIARNVCKDSESGEGWGGAIYSEGDIFVNGATFEYNESSCGGAICIDNGVLTFNGGTICNNIGYTMGGGIFAGGIAKIVFKKSTYINFNEVPGTGSNNGGGGMYLCQGVTVDSTACETVDIGDNVAAKNGGGVYLYATGNYILGSDSQAVKFSRFNFFRNECNTDTSKTYGLGGALFVANQTSTEVSYAVINDSIFEGNKAMFGGAIAVEDNCYCDIGTDSSVRIGSGSGIEGNRAMSNGGGINVGTDANVVLGGFCVVGKESISSDVDASNCENSAGANGGGIYSQGTVTVLDGCKIIGNYAVAGGGIYSEKSVSCRGGTIRYNNISGTNGSDGVHVKASTGFGIGGNFYSTDTVYLESSAYVSLLSRITNLETSVIRIRPSAYTEGIQVVKSEGGNIPQDCSRLSVIKNGSQDWFVSTTGMLTKTAPGSGPAPISMSSLYSDPSVVDSIPASGDLIELASSDDLVYLKTLVNEGNSLSGVELHLTAPVSLSGIWEPIGDSYNAFSGTFDGEGNEVSGISINGKSYSGLFGCIENAVVRNVTVSGSISGAKGNSAGVVGYARGSGSSTVVIENCVNKVQVMGDTSIDDKGIGGILGSGSSRTVIVRNCVNDSGISGYSGVGGIIGYLPGSVWYATLENCVNRGGIGGNSSGTYFGGILGYCYIDEGYLRNNVNMGGVTVTGNTSGSIYGYIKADSIGEISHNYWLSSTGAPSGVTTPPSTSMSSYEISAGNKLVITDPVLVDGISYPANEELLTVLNKWAESNSSETVTYKTWTTVNDTQPDLEM